jgi:hypothetical protein
MNDLITLSIPSTVAYIQAARRFLADCEDIARGESSSEVITAVTGTTRASELAAEIEKLIASDDTVDTATLADLPPGLIENIAGDEDLEEEEETVNVAAAFAPPPAPVAPAPAPEVKILKLLEKAGEITFEQFQAAGWTEQMLVDNQYAVWEVVPPKAPAAPAPSPAVAPPPTTAPTAPTPTSNTVARPYGEQVDKDDMPWDKRIHASTQTTVADGTWKKARGIPEATVEEVRAEHRAAGYGVRKGGAGTSAPTPGAAPAPTAPHVPFMRKLTAHMTALGPKAGEFNATVLSVIGKHLKTDKPAVADLVKPVNAQHIPAIEAELFP